MSKKTVFVDTGAWFAIADKSDMYHQPAKDHLRTILDNGDRLVTSNMIIHETVMLLTRRLSKDAALRFLDLICKAENVEVMQNDAAIEREAYDIFRKYAEHDFSITDCVSFVLMKSHALKRVFAFDKHFRTMRFSVEP